MSTMTKVFIVLTAVLSIAVSCLFIAASAQWTNWRDLAEKYQVLEQAAVSERMNREVIAASSLGMMDDALQARSEALTAAQEQNRELSNELLDAKDELAQRRNEAVAAEAGRKKLEEILSVHTAELSALQKQNQALLTQNIDLQTRNTRLNSRVLELTSNVTILTDQVRNLQEKLYASERQVADLQEAMATGRRVARPGEPAVGTVPVSPAVAGPIRGEIVQVDGSYASINVGESSGVVAGMTFMVHRGATFLAELVVDRVRPEESGGKLTTVQQQVRHGDAVAYGLESAGS